VNVEQPNTVFRNLRSGQFAVAEDAGFEKGPARRHRGSAWGDLNHDGVSTWWSRARRERSWMNAGAGAHWLE
jgi:hypothetical protein